MKAGVFILALLVGHVAGVNAQLTEAGDGTRLSGTIAFTCTPDEKSKATGAISFDDTLELDSDRVKSKVLSGEGFPAALSIPRLINGVSTFTVTFTKGESTARYFIRAKQDGAVSGSLTRTDPGGKTRRYTIGATFLRNTPGAAVGLSPDVLRINGRFVRLMSAHIAIAEAGVKADKDAVNALLTTLGGDHNAMRMALLQGELSPAKFVKNGEARLVRASQDLKQILGDDAAAKRVEAAYDKPYTAAYVYLNQMRAAAMDVASGSAAKGADRAVYQYLVELAILGRQPGKRTPEAIADVKRRALTDVLKAIGPDQKERFDGALAAITSRTPAQTEPTTSPVKVKPS